MKYEVTTLDAARERLDVAIKDMQSDFPDVSDVDLGHEAVCIVLGDETIAPDARRELARRELGWHSKDDADLFARFGL